MAAKDDAIIHKGVAATLEAQNVVERDRNRELIAEMAVLQHRLESLSADNVELKKANDFLHARILSVLKRVARE